MLLVLPLPAGIHSPSHSSWRDVPHYCCCHLSISSCAMRGARPHRQAAGRGALGAAGEAVRGGWSAAAASVGHRRQPGNP
jgi:hypothetical protein